MSSKKISKKDTVVLYSGRFQPFHSGHYEVYSFLKKRYDNVFIVTTNTISKDKKRYPFNFNEKIDIMKNLGNIDIHDIYPEPVSNPYSDFYIKKYISQMKLNKSLPIDVKKRINNIDLTNLLVIFAISDKDMNPTDGTKPRFKFPDNSLVFTKKLNNKGNPTPAKIQKVKSKKHFKNTLFNNISPTTSINYNYVLTVPTNIFSVLGKNINSATQLRDMIVTPPNGFTSENVIESLYNIKKNKLNQIYFDLIISKIKASYFNNSNTNSAKNNSKKRKTQKRKLSLSSSVSTLRTPNSSRKKQTITRQPSRNNLSNISPLRRSKRSRTRNSKSNNI